jgi:hypothetical protein
MESVPPSSIGSSFIPIDPSLKSSVLQVMPIGAGLYTIYYHPEEGPHSPLTEWNLHEGMTRRLKDSRYSSEVVGNDLGIACLSFF